MSATAALHDHVGYKEQVKLMRARTAAEWTTSVFARAIDAFRSKPSPADWTEEFKPPKKRYYGAFYC